MRCWQRATSRRLRLQAKLSKEVQKGVHSGLYHFELCEICPAETESRPWCSFTRGLNKLMQVSWASWTYQLPGTQIGSGSLILRW